MTVRILPGTYLRRNGKFFVLDEQSFKSGRCRLLAVGPASVDTQRIDEETGMPVYTELHAREFAIMLDGEFMVCQRQECWPPIGS